MTLFRNLFFALLACSMLGCHKSKTTWNKLGSVHVIASNHKLIFFIENIQVIDSNRRVYDAPSWRTKCQGYTIVSFDSSQNVESWKTQDRSGIDLNANTSRLFYANDFVYLYCYLGDDGRRIYKLIGGKFLELAGDELANIVKTANLPENQSYYKLEKLDALTQKNGWSYVLLQVDAHDDAITWNGDSIIISTEYIKSQEIYNIQSKTHSQMSFRFSIDKTKTKVDQSQTP